MTRFTLPLSLLLVLVLAAAALGQSTDFPLAEGNVIDDRIPDDQLAQGNVSPRVYAGYRIEESDLPLAFPVANSALGRSWADGDNLKWQVAHGYSVVPVLVELEHRHPSAQRVRVEVYSTHPYAREELQNFGGDSTEMLSRQLAMFSGERLVPPSVPTSFVITPRYIPETASNTVIHLQVLVYMNDVLWDNDELDVLVLDPAHLYYLHLDALIGLPEEFEINPGNELGLDFDAGLDFDNSVLSTLLYSIPTDRRVFTGAPLAARDFAFACVDAAGVRQWPEDEQLALESYMLAGGRLCMYNMQDAWRGFGNTSDSPVGRGYLLPVTGDYEAAKRHMQGWIAGELEEFTLLTGGTVNGYSVPGQAGNSVFGNFGLELDEVYGRDRLTGTLPSRRPGYLHPVWLYRELSSDNSVEPWDYPEYQLRKPRSSGQLSNRLALDSVMDSRSRREAALLDAVVPPRHFPLALAAVSGLLLLALVLPGRLRPRRQLPLAILLAVAMLVLWTVSRPLEFRPVSLLLMDRDLRAQTATTRRLSVLLSDNDGNSRIEMPQDALLRRVVASPPGSFNQHRDRNSAIFDQQGSAQSVNLYSDEISSEPDEFPVRVGIDSHAGRSRITLDTSGLRRGQSCVLQTALGYQHIRAGEDAVVVNMNHLPIPVHPGLERIRVIRSIHEGGPGQGNPNIARFGAMLSGLQEEISSDSADSLAAICWEGILRQPFGLLGTNQSQAVLLLVSEDVRDNGNGVQELRVERLCLPLGEDS